MVECHFNVVLESVNKHNNLLYATIPIVRLLHRCVPSFDRILRRTREEQFTGLDSEGFHSDRGSKCSLMSCDF